MIKDFLIADGVAVSVHEAPGSSKGCILSPGFLDSKDYAGLVGLAHDLNAAGWIVVRVQPYGTWESNGSIVDYTTTRRLKDIDEVIAWTHEKYELEHIALGGHSMGGRLSILYAAKHPEIAAVVNIMGSAGAGTALSWPADGIYRSNRDIPGSDEVRSFAVPKSFVDDALRYNAQEVLRTMHLPVLFIAGEMDRVVPLARIQEGFEAANEPKKFVTIPGIGHDYRKHPEQIPLVNKVVLDFLKEHNI